MNKKKDRKVLYISLVFVLFYQLFCDISLFQRFDNVWLDFLTRTQAQKNQPDPDIVVIDIDDLGLRWMNEVVGRWPWPRSVHAELVDFLVQQGARAIVFDILFSERDLHRPDSDEYFKEVVESHNNVYLPILLQPENELTSELLSSYQPYLPLEKTAGFNSTAKASLLLPVIIAPEHWNTGTINYLEDFDGVGRRYAIFNEVDGWRLLSLPAVIARDMETQLPVGDAIILNWQKETSRPYMTYSYASLYGMLQQGIILPQMKNFQDKIVIIGSTASGLHDIRHTPIDSLYPAVYMLTTAIDNLLNNEYLVSVPDGLVRVLMILLVITLYYYFYSTHRLLYLAFLLSLISLTLFASSYWLIQDGYLFPVLNLVTFVWAYFFILSFLQYIQTYNDKRQTVSLFQRFLDPTVVKQLVSQDMGRSAMESQNCRATVLFSDIRNFTSLSENSQASEIVALLNQYFSHQVQVIFNHGGTLDKFIGDAIMAFWGAPIARENQEIDAVNAALDMVDNLERFKSDTGSTTFDIGIGIHSGDAIAGMIGSEQRYDYTIIGDTVNLASRIEGLTKNRARILISQTTRDACKDYFDYIDHGLHKVKGREQMVHVYEPRRKHEAQ